MADEEGVVLSVRGEAQRMVAPDSVVLAGSITAWRTSKPDALGAAAAALDRLTAELSGLGGVPLAVGAQGSALAWSAFSATTSAERHHDKETGGYEPTGRVVAAVDVGIAVRDFGLLDAVGAVFAGQEDFNVHQVTWNVDDDNPGWSAVRADAIRAALHKGRDYAAALGVSLSHVEHVADTGLLGGSGDGHRANRFSAAGLQAGGGHGGGDVDTPSLDQVPQELAAVIEARFRATPASRPT